MSEFNLIDEPWIPCIDLQNMRVEYGIRDTFLNAHKLREICDDSPLVTVALHRLLLAILYRACKGPSNMKTWQSLFERGKLEQVGNLDEYLNAWHEHFFLFHDKFPFMQVAGLDLNKHGQDGGIKKNKSDGLMRLAREAPDKGGRILFDHRVGTERRKYEPKHVARMMLSAQSFSGTGVASSGKIKDKPINPTPCSFASCVNGLVLWLQGESLFHTLLLNLVPFIYNQSDKPSWEDESFVEKAIQSWKNPVSFAGPVQRFTSLNRFILVIDQQSMFFTNGLKTVNDSDDPNDPMKAYSRSDDTSQYIVLKLREDKAVWRDAHTLYSLGSSTCKPPAALNHLAQLVQGKNSQTVQVRANIVGLATDQGKALLWRHERIPVSVELLNSIDLTERLAMLISEAEAIGSELSRGLFLSAATNKTIRNEPVGRIQMIADLLLNPSLKLKGNGFVRTTNERFPDDAHNASCLSLSAKIDPRPAYWARMEEHFLTLLSDLPNDWDTVKIEWKPDEEQTATRTWHEHLKREAKQALEESIRSLGTTARAIQAVARVRTDFNDDDLKPQPKMLIGKKKTKGGKKK